MIQIELTTNSFWKRRLKKRLSKILMHYGSQLNRWQFTERIVIGDGGISRSHPVLTIGVKTKGMRTDEGLLALYVHEQLHWFLVQHPVQARNALRHVRHKYPQVKVGPKEGGTKTTLSAYVHLIVCTLEYDALRTLIGNASATKLLVSKPYYQWVYNTVVHDFEALRQICDFWSLIPAKFTETL